LLHQVSRRLDPQIFNRLGRRLPRVRVEGPAELARAEVSCVSELRHRQGLVQIFPRVALLELSPKSDRIQTALACRKLRLSAAAAMIDDELAGHGFCELGP
jgi:hypothetical protein